MDAPIVASRMPPRDARRTPPDASCPQSSPRPLTLFPTPVEILVVCEPSDDRTGRPRQFTWRGAVYRLIHAVGPERIAGEWWRGHHRIRDYYDVEDAAGQRLALPRPASRTPMAPRSAPVVFARAVRLTAFPHGEIRSTKHETRNKLRNGKGEMAKRRPPRILRVAVSAFLLRDFEFVSDFVLRISCFLRQRGVMPEHPSSKLYTGSAINPPTEVAASAFDYAELDVTTNFSFLRGASHPDELVYTAAMLGCRAMAVTDINTLAGVVRAWEAARKVKGFQLIIGARLVFNDGSPDLLAWPADRDAYARLSAAHPRPQAGRKGECHSALDDFLDHSEGMLAATRPGLEPRAPDLKPSATASATRWATGCRWRSACVTATTTRPFSPARRKFAKHTRDPAAGDQPRPLPRPRPPAAAGRADLRPPRLHDRTRPGYRLFPNAERHLKSPAQMHRLFADYRRPLRRGLEIADRCTFSLDELRYDYPDELVPAGPDAVAITCASSPGPGPRERYPAGHPGEGPRGCSSTS